MTNRSEVWKTESSAGMQWAASVGALLLGGVLVIAFRHFRDSGSSGSLAAFGLGVLLVAVGAGMLVFGGQQAVTVDARRRRIVLERKGLLGHKVRTLEFSEVSSLDVSELGDNEGGRTRYYVAARLRSGEELSLFLGFFDGAHDRAAMEARRQRLAGLLGIGG